MLVSPCLDYVGSNLKLDRVNLGLPEHFFGWTSYQLMCPVTRDIVHHPLVLPLVGYEHGLLGFPLFMVVPVSFHELIFESFIGVPFESPSLLGGCKCWPSW